VRAAPFRAKAGCSENRGSKHPLRKPPPASQRAESDLHPRRRCPRALYARLPRYQQVEGKERLISELECTTELSDLTCDLWRHRGPTPLETPDGRVVKKLKRNSVRRLAH
jgi:hypothetical protein